MRTDLSIPRDRLIVELEPSDGFSARDVQFMLRQSGVSFVTLDAAGAWEVTAQEIERLEEALSTFKPYWTDAAASRLDRVRQTRAEQQVSESQIYALARHSLSTVSDIGRPPFREQLEAAKFMSAPGIGRFALFWKPGTGKTEAMLIAANELLSKRIISGVLIVAERPISMMDPWKNELDACLPWYASVADYVALIGGDKKNRLETYLVDPTWLIIHYGLLWVDQAAIKAWARRKEAIERPVVIFDESDLIKNPEAKRSKAAMAIRQECGRCWIASGTPAPHTPSDYEYQMSVLCGYPTNLGLTGIPEEDALVVIHEFEKGIYYLQQDNPRRMPETIIPVLVRLTPGQRQAYDELAKNLVEYLGSIDDDTFRQQRVEIDARRINLLRVCSDPAHETLGTLGFQDSAKTTKVDEILREILSDPMEKVVVWTRFRDTAKKLWLRYRSQYGAALLIGGGEGSANELRQPGCRVLIATIQMGASSITLTAARNAIYESLDDVSRNFTQSMARINRTGQTKDCSYWVLVSKDTVEEQQFEAILNRVSLSEHVLDEIGTPGRAELIEQLKRSLQHEID